VSFKDPVAIQHTSLSTKTVLNQKEKAKVQIEPKSVHRQHGLRFTCLDGIDASEFIVST
jgi:hypothetical protein